MDDPAARHELASGGGCQWKRATGTPRGAPAGTGAP
jgi:hypothetical protein